MDKTLTAWLNQPFLRDYGMIFVLVLLVGIFSALTINEQHPTGASAGEQVANFIVSDHGSKAQVLIVGRATKEDRGFTKSAEVWLKSSGVTVLATINGNPADVRKALDAIRRRGQTVDAIAANEVTASWTVYDRYPDVGKSKCVTPRSYVWPDFLKVTNILGVANQTAIYAILAIGMTLVIITGGIDLSIGSLVALSSVTATLFIRDIGGGTNAHMGMMLLGCFLGITLCGLAGLYHGVLITEFRVPAFVVTLGMMMIARGLSRWLSNGVSIADLPETFFILGAGKTLGIPNPILLMVVLYAIAHVFMSETVLGRYIYAIGGNKEAARLSGVPVQGVLIAVYTICGLLAGLSGIVLASQLRAGDPKFGMMYELEVIAAVVVGGASLMGGQGKIFGTLIGAFIISVIKNGMNLTGVDPDSQLIVLGAVLTGAVLLDALKRRGAA